MEKVVALMVFSFSLALTFVGCGTNGSGNTENINRANFSNTTVGSNNILQTNGNSSNTTSYNAINSNTGRSINYNAANSNTLNTNGRANGKRTP